MTYKYTHWSDFLATQTIHADEGCVRIQRRNLLAESRWEYSYAELRPSVTRGRVGDGSCSKLGWAGLAVAVLIAGLFDISYTKPVSLGLPDLFLFLTLALASAAFLSRFLKFEGVWFDTRQEAPAFFLVVPRSRKAEADALVEEITRRAAEAHSGP